MQDIVDAGESSIVHENHYVTGASADVVVKNVARSQWAKAKTCLLVCSFLGFSGLAYADLTHSNDLLIGSKASGMGGAFSAISDDVSAIHYNPAGFGFIKSGGVSISGYSVARKLTTYENIFGKQDFSYRSSSFVPSLIGGVFKPQSDWTIGFAVYTTTSEIANQEDEVRDAKELYLRRFYNKLKAEYLVETYAGAIAHKVSPELSIGLKLGVVRTVLDKQQYSNIRFTEFKDLNGGTYDLEILQNSHDRGDALTAFLGVGILAKFSQVSIGLSVEKGASYKDEFSTSADGHVLPIDNQGSPIPTSNEAIPAANKFHDFNSHSSGKLLGNVPVRGRFGASIAPMDDWVIASDIEYTGSSSQADGVGARKSIVNASSGINYSGIDNYEFSCGYFTNLDSAANIDNSSATSERIDYRGITVGVGGTLESTRVELSYIYQLGKGEARAFTVGDLRTTQTVSSKISVINLGITRLL